MGSFVSLHLPQLRIILATLARSLLHWKAESSRSFVCDAKENRAFLRNIFCVRARVWHTP
jgi:hypothetical protein